MAFTYIVKCIDDSLYTGACISISERMKDHYYKKDKCAKYTKSRQIVSLEALWVSENLSTACKLEWCIKKLSRKKKIDLINHPGKLLEVYGVHLTGIEYRYVEGVGLEEFLDENN